MLDLVTLGGVSAGTLNGGLPRPLLDRVTLEEGVAGRGGSFPEVLRFPGTLGPLQVCLRPVLVGGIIPNGATTGAGVDGSDTEYDL